MTVRRFVDDDAAYERWVADYPSGFVVNCHRDPGPDYLVLHRATCASVTVLQPTATTWTNGDYAKVCSDSRDDLIRWASSVVGGELKPCGLCGP